jgi:hypothetical protein
MTEVGQERQMMIVVRWKVEFAGSTSYSILSDLRTGNTPPIDLQEEITGTILRSAVLCPTYQATVLG